MRSREISFMNIVILNEWSYLKLSENFRPLVLLFYIWIFLQICSPQFVNRWFDGMNSFTCEITNLYSNYGLIFILFSPTSPLTGLDHWMFYLCEKLYWQYEIERGVPPLQKWRG